MTDTPDLTSPEAVKPLDLSTILKHAFLSGVVAARNIPAGDPCDGSAFWTEYEPYEPGSYKRILSALEPAPDHADWDAAIEAAAKVANHYQCSDKIRALKKGPDHE